ncbi:hypothetical protein NC651_014724 [Populus alba x Populus x berolinensis]|nr:hypothetical protein NC651_014724 [Populus alba x Populus x berolinensis]
MALSTQSSTSSQIRLFCKPIQTLNPSSKASGQPGGDRSVGKENAEGKRRERVDMDVFGSDAVSKRRVASGMDSWVEKLHQKIGVDIFSQSAHSAEPAIAKAEIKLPQQLFNLDGIKNLKDTWQVRNFPSSTLSIDLCSVQLIQRTGA